MTRASSIAVLVLLCGCATTRRDASAPTKPTFPYRFEGTVAVKEAELIDSAKLELLAFETKGRHAADLDDAAYAMRRYLRREGFAHAKVGVRPEPSPEAISAVTFILEEGPKARWGTISFPGVQTQDEALLRKFFVAEKKRKGLVDPEEEPAPFRATDLEAGLGHVEGLYLGDGYYRVKVGPPKVTWSEDRSVAAVEIPIVENRRYLVKEVVIVSDDGSLPTEGLHAEAAEFEGGPYHPRVAARVAAAVRAALARDGRILAKVVSAAEVDDAAATAVVKVTVRPGPRVVVGGVDVHGQERTRESFMLDRARLHAGEILTGDRLEQATNGLYGTGLFKSVKVEPVVPPGTESRPAEDVYEAQIAIAVEELLSRTVDFEVGWGSYELLRGSVRYRDRNLFGTGRDFEVEPSASVKSYGVEMRFYDRYVFGEPDTLEILTGAYHRQEPSFDLLNYHAEVAVRRRFSERLMGRAGFRFELSNASNVHVDDDEEERPTTITSGPFVTLQYDRRDNPILPERGYNFDLGAALSSSALGANVDFLDLNAEASVYFRLAEGLVLGLSAHGQTRPTLDGSPTLPIQERLFLGGANSVRSFGEDELGPTDADGDPFGGLTTLDATIELRQRLIGDFYGAVFYDVGSVGDHSFDLDGFGHAIGIGLRYYLPMGPIRLDIGYNPGPHYAAGSDVAVHFSFGFSF